MPESPASSQRPFDFGDLGRPMPRGPKSVRSLPQPPQPPQPPTALTHGAADASGQLEELSGDDILESDDIDALEAAAAGFASFEVGDVGAFDEVEVEGVTVRAAVEAAPAPAPAPAPVPASIGAVAVVAPAVAPVVKVVEMAAPLPTTLMGMPAAPVTSPLPLEAKNARDEDEKDELEKKKEEESVAVSEPAPVTARTPATMQSAITAPAAAAAPVVEKTLEIRGNDMAKVAAAAAKLASEPEQTEVLVRSAMPASLSQRTARAMQPASGQSGHMAVGPAAGRPSSVAPVAVDVSRPLMPVIPPMARVPSLHVPPRGMPVRPAAGLSGLAIGGMAAAAILLVGLVGIGGYAASRTLSAKTDAVEAPSETSASGEATTTAAGVAAPNGATGAAAEPPGAASSPIDVSSLPSAPVPGAAPRGFTGKGSFAVTPPPPPPPVAAAPQVAAAPAAPEPRAAAAAPAAPPVARSSGGALAAPGGGSGRSAPAGAPLAAPPSTPTVAAAPVAAAPVATTGVVHVDPNLRAVVVDGSFRHANDGSITVSCGSHRIKAGMKETQTVNVPCGGAVSL